LEFLAVCRETDIISFSFLQLLQLEPNSKSNPKKINNPSQIFAISRASNSNLQQGKDGTSSGKMLNTKHPSNDSYYLQGLAFKFP
jgi:hypothetical protein